jgi:hypothetical protein
MINDRSTNDNHLINAYSCSSINTNMASNIIENETFVAHVFVIDKVESQLSKVCTCMEKGCICEKCDDQNNYEEKSLAKRQVFLFKIFLLLKKKLTFIGVDLIEFLVETHTLISFEFP